MTLKVVTNAGPLLVLAKLNELHLLKRLYGTVSIPSAVYEETVVTGLHQGYEDASTFNKLRIATTSGSVQRSAKEC